MDLRFFKCNILGGFRLSDINKNVRQGEYFHLDAHVCITSRAVVAALRENWMIEISEKEASKFMTVPRDFKKSGVQEFATGPKAAVSRSMGVALPNTSETNKSIESRQVIANKKSEKPILPDFAKVEKNSKERNADSSNNVGASSDLELAEGLKDTEVAAGPDFKETRRNLDVRQAEKSLVVTKPEVDIVKTVETLVDDSMFDNSQLSTPNFDEKEESQAEVKEESKVEIKEEIKAQIETKVKQKRIAKEKTDVEPKIKSKKRIIRKTNTEEVS